MARKRFNKSPSDTKNKYEHWKWWSN